MILSKWVRISVIVFFLVTFSVSIAFAPRASIAFEPELSVADDSYLANYYKVIFFYIIIHNHKSNKQFLLLKYWQYL